MGPSEIKKCHCGLISKLQEIKAACEVATSDDDTNLNLIIEDIRTLADCCISRLQAQV